MFQLQFMLKLVALINLLLKGCELFTLNAGQLVAQWIQFSGAVVDPTTKFWQTRDLDCLCFERH